MIWILYIILEAIAQFFFLFKRGIKPNYKVLLIIRVILAIIYGRLVLDTEQDTMWRWFGQVILPFAFTFNQTTNILRGKTYDYVGENSGFIEPLIFKYKLQKTYFFFTLALFVSDLIWFIRW